MEPGSKLTGKKDVAVFSRFESNLEYTGTVGQNSNSLAVPKNYVSFLPVAVCGTLSLIITIILMLCHFFQSLEQFLILNERKLSFVYTARNSLSFLLCVLGVHESHLSSILLLYWRLFWFSWS